MKQKPFIAFADGTVLEARSFGADTNVLGEVIFNTGMTGYQEILTDPSYKGQIVTLTYPEIGNTGFNPEDYESAAIQANGLLVHHYNAPSNYRSRQSLADALIAAGVPALEAIDTRALTLRLRENGSQKAFLCATGTVPHEEAVGRARDWEGLDGQDYASRVTTDRPYDVDTHPLSRKNEWTRPPLVEPPVPIVCYDFGVKYNILRELKRAGFSVRVVPARTPAEEVLQLNPQGVFLSNGPADPAAVTYAVDNIKRLLGKVPIFGICLGHQLLGTALGGRTVRLKFGHHGCNHPVIDLATKAVAITSQNHNFCLDAESLDPQTVEVTHLNLNDQTIEGIRARHLPAFSVQYHPEAAPGPHDANYLFAEFRKLIGKQRKN
ncbi:MAG: glutamine-hydrolyzing carbamoyl-phosphate synthase small subunit [Kiritimatiellia bacterium]